MIRRLAGIALVLLAVGGLAFLLVLRSDDPKPGKQYTVELDSAFGLVEGGDLKIAGVAAGTIDEVDLDLKTKRALIDVSVTKSGFGSLRRDVRCEVLPQSLVGEYYVDCQPGTDRRELPEGSTIPVSRTVTTVPPDLVNNIMRRPARERLRLIIGELGAAVAGNADNLNAALRRATPALRETNRVLNILARHNTVLADLVTDADEVIGELAENRKDVGRWVVEARDTASATAERDRELAAGFRRLPTFLRELRPTMVQLGEVADAQGPALETLASSSDQLERLFDNLEPFANASRPAISSLGEVAQTGRPAVRPARATVAELSRATPKLEETSRNLRFITEHLDDRENAVEDDPRSPGGKGYTGWEAFLQYIFDQTMAINLHDGATHMLKVFPFQGNCVQYGDIKSVEERGEQCAQTLGPNSLGVNFKDPSQPEGYDRADRGPKQFDRDPDDNNENGLPQPPPRNATARAARPEPPLTDGFPGSNKPTNSAAQGLLDFLLSE